MKSKKNVFVILSFFIVVMFILTLFGQKPKIEDRVAALETKVAALETWKSTQKALGPPDYDSGWIGIRRGQTENLYHKLGGNPSNYIVDLQCDSDDRDLSQARWISWQGLSSVLIQIYSPSGDIEASKRFRVRIWKY